MLPDGTTIGDDDDDDDDYEDDAYYHHHSHRYGTTYSLKQSDKATIFQIA